MKTLVAAVHYPTFKFNGGINFGDPVEQQRAQLDIEPREF